MPRRTYKNRKLQAATNLEETTSLRVEKPHDVVHNQPLEGSLSVTAKIPDVPLDPSLQEVPEELVCQKSPVPGCSKINVCVSHTTSTPVKQTNDSLTVGASHISANSTCEPENLEWDSMIKNCVPQVDFRPITPDFSKIPVDELVSPKTQKEVMSTIRSLFPNGPPPPPPVKPVRRPEKGDKPYIVGCTKRRRVPSPKSLTVFQGDKYGITDKTNCDEDEQCSPAKRSRRGPRGTASLSKSRFNLLSDDVAGRLKLHEKIDRLLGRTPKEETVGYMSKPSSFRSQAFSPLPSTSTDKEIIMKNDKHFSESFNYDDNFDIEDDEDLPEIVWESSKSKQEKSSPLTLINGQTTNNKSDSDNTLKTTHNKNDFDNTPIVLDEDMNNNNNVTPKDYDICEIGFDKYMPKEKPFACIGEEEVNIKPKVDPDVIDTIDLIEGRSSMPSRVIPTTCTDVICIDDDFNAGPCALKKDSAVSNNGNVINSSSTQEPADPTTSTVLRASNKMPSASGTTSDSVIEVPDILEPTVNTASQASIGRTPTWNEDVQFVCETKINEPRLSNSENREEISIVQIVDPSQSSVNSSRNHYCELLTQLHPIFPFLSHSSRTGRRQSQGKRNNKKQSRQRQSATNMTVVENNENTAPTVNQVSTPASMATTQPPTSSDQSPTNGRKLGECPICLENLTRGSIASTICGHVFCLDCIKTYLKVTGRRCPTCRRQLKKRDYHQVFL